MWRSNPAIIPRNHLVEEILSAAERDDLSGMERFMSAMREPYAYSAEQEEYTALPVPASCRYRTFCGT